MQGLQTTRDAAAQTTTDALNAIESCNKASKLEEANIESTIQVSVETALLAPVQCLISLSALQD